MRTLLALLLVATLLVLPTSAAAGETQRFWVKDTHRYSSPWYAGERRKMINSAVPARRASPGPAVQRRPGASTTASTWRCPAARASSRASAARTSPPATGYRSAVRPHGLLRLEC